MIIFTDYERKTISVNEFNRITGVSESTVRRWLKDGNIKGIKAGKRKWLIPVSELTRLISPDS